MPIRKRQYAIIYGQFAALHCWPDAPDDVSFLRNPHRHLFAVTVWIEVKHDNREIEYYQCKRVLATILAKMVKPMTFSCEQYCDVIQKRLEEKYGSRRYSIKVQEDGKEGASAEYYPTT